MSTLVAFGVGCARTWVALYTLGLASALKEQRRSEIDSDLWEQQWLASRRGDSGLSTAAEIVTRTLLGILDDISWRLTTGASSRKKGMTTVNNSWLMRVGFVIALVPLALLTLAGVSFLLGNGDWEDSWEHWAWRGFFVALPIVGGIGLWLCASRPVLGMALVLVGVGASAFLMPWMAFVTVPFGIAIIAFALFRSGYLLRPSSRQQSA